MESLAHKTLAQCCVSGGEKQQIAATHFKLKGVPLSLSGQSSLVSFNEAAFRAYGMREDDLPAPVSVPAMLAYTGSLNHMLGPPGKKHRRVVGDTAFLFWGDETAMEQVAEVLNEPTVEKDAKERMLDAAEVFASPFSGYASDQIAEVNVLGLTAAQARAAVSFWSPGRAVEISRNIHAWVDEVGFGPHCAWGEPMGELNCFVRPSGEWLDY